MLRCAVSIGADCAHAKLWWLWGHLVSLPCAQFDQIAVCLQVQQHCDAVDPEQRPKHTRALMRSLADWAEAHRALNEVIQLPLSTLEEEASLMVVHVCLLVAMRKQLGKSTCNPALGV